MNEPSKCALVFNENWRGLVRWATIWMGSGNCVDELSVRYILV